MGLRLREILYVVLNYLCNQTIPMIFLVDQFQTCIVLSGLLATILYSYNLHLLRQRGPLLVLPWTLRSPPGSI